MATRIYFRTIMENYEFISAYKQLRPVERAFVDAYLAELCTSAEKAGQRVRDFLIEQTGDKRQRLAKWHTDKMMANPLVHAAIAERIDQLTKQMEIDAFKVLKEVANIATASVGNYMTVNVMGLPEFNLATATPEQLAAIQSVELEYDRDGCPKRFKFKLHDKLSALDKLMKVMGMLDKDGERPQVVQTVRPSAPQQQIAASATTAQAADLYARTLRRGLT